MNVVDFISVKRDGGEHADAQIEAFIGGVTSGAIADYQISAWLMAVYLRGMTARETLTLTLAMRDSGQVIDLSDLPNGPAIDKHSTGGVGDKTTLVVVPIVAAADIPLLKMSGRGLGHSGGTVDKLESIPGFRTDLSVDAAKKQVAEIGAALIAQSAELAPADKILYALRDVTATIECLPLIASSIMSKKLASGGAKIVLDVKVGRGAFMKTRERAEALARMMIEIGNGAGVPTSALLTAMDEPLGRNIGNALEVQEALDLLAGSPDVDGLFRALCLDLAAHGIHLMGKAASETEAHQMAAEILASGRAANKFGEIVEAQGGHSTLSDIRKGLPQTEIRHPVLAESGGVVAGLDAEAVGRLAVSLGAGRAAKADRIDPAVGIALNRKTGDAVSAGEVLAVLHLRNADAERAEAFSAVLQKAYSITPEAQAPRRASLVIAALD
jgi:pyrimidine-nucleoside phosphorylase